MPHEINGRVVWESRSVAVVGVIMVYKGTIPYVLVSRRGPNSADFQGKMNLVAGYLDWDETGTQALIRECWEETGFDVMKYTSKFIVSLNNLENPWSVNTLPTTNHQNVTLRYGILMKMSKTDEFPSLTTEYNEIEGEIENPQWLLLSEVQNHEWAFDHDIVIQSYNRYLSTQF
jgi:8-oxo-dGTP pyrophosphatase MutT (NUDIX family)